MSDQPDPWATANFAVFWLHGSGAPSADTIAAVRDLYRDDPAAMAAALLNMRADNARLRAGLGRLVAAVERDDNCIDQGHFSGSEEMRAARAALAQ